MTSGVYKSEKANKARVLRMLKIRKPFPSTRGGQAALYRKLRLLINEGKICCENCKSKKNVEIHHKDKLKYDEQWRNWKAENFNNDKDNISFLCNSCHQKLHYRVLGRKSLVKHDEKTGRFISNEDI